MRVTAQVERAVVETEVTDVLCNRCGKSCSTVCLDGGRLCNFEGLIEATVSGGYASPVIGDGRSWTFSICEPCLAEIAKDFKIPVEET